MKTIIHLPIRWKITGLAFGIVAFSLVIIGIILLGYMKEVKEREFSQKAMLTGQLIAQNKTVQMSIELENASEILQPLVERVRMVNSNDYIVILNMNRERLTHPIPERLHTKFEGGDEDAAFSQHIYISKASAGNAQTVRAFVPILNENREQIGVVVVGNVLPHLSDLIYEFRHSALVMTLITTLFGFWGAWLLANHIKRQTFEMEPDELARLLVERTAAFNAIHEGVIAIDDQERITVINKAAKEMLNVKEPAVGKKIRNVIPDTRLPEILQLREPLMQREFYIQNRPILSNRIPIIDGGKTIGAVAIFQDKSDVNRLAQELTGVQAFVDALRVRNHEYSNTLHTIAGLIQLNQNEKALHYIFEWTEEQSGLSQELMQQFRDESLIGLILGKISRGKELGISLKVNKTSAFMHYPEGITIHDIVVILGNLIDNSFDALSTINGDEKNVYLVVKEEEEALFLQVSDTGPGIPPAVQKRMFTRGFSTKEKEGRGIGLFLVQSIVDRVEGSINIDSEENEGTTISIFLPMQRGMSPRDEEN
ncbi:ATP-binding protein [Paenibacillus faecalis]|uniref:ATP-binding protein n=1 Tax=Paenibacillus faecalis TaxID=2079532 RepID=UPI001F2C2CD7|nr:sensor histidine kinase [Paenibacillus faecalis]